MLAEQRVFSVLLAVVFVTCPLLAVNECLGQRANDSSGRARQHIVDVRLAKGRVLLGQLVHVPDEQSVQRVEIRQNGRPVRLAQTDSHGRFQVANLRGGVYEIATNRSVQTVRAWTNDVAPPDAHDIAVLESPRLVMRGQQVPRPPVSYSLGSWMSSHPVLTYTALTAAIVIPIVAIADDDDVPRRRPAS